MIPFLASQWHTFSTLTSLSNTNEMTLSLDKNKETKSLRYEAFAVHERFSLKNKDCIREIL